jgi:transposase-like protein
MVMQSQHKDFIQARNSGVSIRELCERFNISKSTTYNWIKKYSLVKRTKERTISVHRIYQLERENHTLRAENEIFRRSKCSVISPIDEKIAAIEL